MQLTFLCRNGADRQCVGMAQLVEQSKVCMVVCISSLAPTFPLFDHLHCPKMNFNLFENAEDDWGDPEQPPH